MTRAEAIAAKCRDCICDRHAAGHWTAQVACCACTNCPLWGFRPLPRTAPDWIKSRSPADLPAGWRALPQEVAVRAISSPSVPSVGTYLTSPAAGVQGEHHAAP